MTLQDPAMAEGADQPALRTLYDELHRAHLEALWRINTRIMPLEPKPRARPWRWRFDTLARLAEQAGKLVPIDRGGDRRVLAAINPGLTEAFGDGVHGATSTLWAAVQYLGPRESAPGHRHSPSALRFVAEGQGAWTTVDGERCMMSPGDLVLTPSYAWHDHVNTSDEPMMWFDGLDLPLVAYLDAQFFEFYPVEELQPVLDTHASERSFAAPGLLPRTVPPVTRGAGAAGPPEGSVLAPRSPVLRYPWERTEEALDAVREDEGDPYDGTLLTYTNPRTGGPILPTLDATIQLLQAGTATLPHRHVHSTVYQVFRGGGFSVVDGRRFDWERGDILAVPPWAAHEHHTPDGEAIMFAITDEPVIRALGLERTIPLGEHQQVTGTFSEDA